ncbi:MAG: hypothetical protein M3R15_01435 [Acidobacteriota bacterium]|nr:hypothetical protein [Acidobacteriota bacterium]
MRRRRRPSIGADKAIKSSPFDAAIDEALNSGDAGRVLEGQVATYVKDDFNDLVAFDKKIGPNGSIGQIDVESGTAIIEVTTQSAGKLGQLQDYINNTALNPSGKAVVMYAPNYTRNAARAADKAGIHVVRNKQELLELLGSLRKEY